MEIITIIIIVGTIWGLVQYDLGNWGNVNHTVGFVIAAIVMISLSLWNWHPWPILVYTTVWNPIIAIAAEQEFFYIGDTAWTDKTLKKIVGSRFAGEIWFFGWLALTYLSFVFIPI